ncbi:hypothetical protein BDV11DRAFT_184310 [Aspergillus similis]
MLQEVLAGKSDATYSSLCLRWWIELTGTPAVVSLAGCGFGFTSIYWSLYFYFDYTQYISPQSF